GVKKGAMVRWFNTNTFYFTPVVAGELLSDGSAVSRTFNTSLVKSGAITKVILPDPLTFVALAENSHYTTRERLIVAYCDNVLRPEVEHLSRMGIGYVQLSSPGVVARFREKPLPRAELEQAGEGLKTV